MAPTYAAWQNNTHKSWWKDPGMRKMMRSIFVLYCAVFTFGYDGSLLTGLQTMNQWQTFFNRPKGHDLGLISASFYFPKLVAPIFASFIAERFGRRMCLLIGALITVGGSIVNGMANGVGMFIAGRVLLGAGTAFQATVAPPLLAELAHPRLRAVTAGSYLCVYYVGATISSWLCFGLLDFESVWAWRIPCIFQCIGSVVIAVFILCGLMHESPRWLMNKGREEDAYTIMCDLHANGDRDDELVRNQFIEIKAGLSADRDLKYTGYSAFLKTPGNRKRLTVVMVLATGTQLTGNGLVGYYLSPILKLVGITAPVQQAGINAGLAMFNLIVATVAAQFVERLGRRPLWLAGTFGIICSWAVATGLSGSFAASGSKAVGTAVVPFFFIFYGFYDVSWTILPNLYIPEILPYSIRSQGMSIYVMTQAVSLAFNQYVNPIALEAIQWKYYTVYLAVQVGYFVFAYYMLQETKGRTIEEVSRLFDGKAKVEELQAHVEASGIEMPNAAEDDDSVKKMEVSHVEVKGA